MRRIVSPHHTFQARMSKRLVQSQSRRAIEQSVEFISNNSDMKVEMLTWNRFMNISLNIENKWKKELLIRHIKD